MHSARVFTMSTHIRILVENEGKRNKRCRTHYDQIKPHYRTIASTDDVIFFFLPSCQIPKIYVRSISGATFFLRGEQPLFTLTSHLRCY